MEIVAAGGEAERLTSSSTCSMEVLFGTWDDEEEHKKRVIESERAAGGGTRVGSCGAK